MTDDPQAPTGSGRPPLGSVLQPEVLDPAGAGGVGHSSDDAGGEDAEGAEAGEASESSESIQRPAKVLRIGSMVKQLLEEVRQSPLDEAGRARLKEIYGQSLDELRDALSPDLVEELDRVSLLFSDDTPSDAELRIAQAQLVGWLEGLFHGIQAALVAQQVAAQAQLSEMRQRSLPPGAEAGTTRPGTYL